MEFALSRLVFLFIFFNFGANANSLIEKKCSDCILKVKSLDKPISLIGRWLFTKYDKKENSKTVLKPDLWKAVDISKPWTTYYKGDRNFKVGWHRKDIIFDHSLVGKKIKMVFVGYTPNFDLFMNGKLIASQKKFKTGQRFYTSDVVEVDFKIPSPHVVIAVRFDSFNMKGFFALPFELRSLEKNNFDIKFLNFFYRDTMVFASVMFGCASIFFLFVFILSKRVIYKDASFQFFFAFIVYQGWCGLFVSFVDPELSSLSSNLGFAGISHFACRFVRRFGHLPKFEVYLFPVTFSLPIATLFFLLFGINVWLINILREVSFFGILILTCVIAFYTIKFTVNRVRESGLTRKKTKSLLMLTVSSLIALGTAINDVNSSLLTLGYFTLHIGLMLQVLTIFFLVSKKIGDSYKENGELLKKAKMYALTLEDKVKERTVMLDKKNEELVKSNEARIKFYQNISHELRTPLTLILNPLEFLKNKYKDDKDIEIADKSSKRLLKLVNQLLELQKISFLSQKVEIRSIDIAYLAFHCSEIFKYSCESRGINFRFFINRKIVLKKEDLQPVYICGELDSLEKIIFNYLTNALKHTPINGSITLEIHISNETTSVKVTDSGVGIKKENKDSLFKPFSQLNDGPQKNGIGTGLGLALSKDLAISMNGEVGVESEIGKGCSFWVKLNNSKDGKCEANDTIYEYKDWSIENNKSPDLDFKDNYEHDANKNTLLIIDDIKEIREIIGRTLSPNYNIKEASHGKMGLELAKKLRPDLIIVDWMMPILNGPEFVKEIKNDPDLSTIPVILLTAKVDEDSKFSGHKIGADSFLGKPFNEEELNSVVFNLIKLKRKEKELEAFNKKITEDVLMRYLSPDLVSSIMKGNLKIEQKAKKTQGTVLFVDICGFTELSSKLRASGAASILNEFLGIVIDIVFHNKGTIDKFIGDGVMVLFGAPMPMDCEMQVGMAIKSSCEIHAKMKEISQKWEETYGVNEVKVRIGIHQGPLLVGNFGSEKRVDYTAIGPAVNLASKIQELSRPGRTLVSGVVCDFLDEELLGESEVYDIKGISGEMRLFEIVEISQDQGIYATMVDGKLILVS